MNPSVLRVCCTRVCCTNKIILCRVIWPCRHCSGKQRVVRENSGRQKTRFSWGKKVTDDERCVFRIKDLSGCPDLKTRCAHPFPLGHFSLKTWFLGLLCEHTHPCSMQLLVYTSLGIKTSDSQHPGCLYYMVAVVGKDQNPSRQKSISICLEKVGIVFLCHQGNSTTALVSTNLTFVHFLWRKLQQTWDIRHFLVLEPCAACPDTLRHFGLPFRQFCR